MQQLEPVSISPEGHIEPSAFFDEEAEQVRQKFLEEQKEEEEAGEMALHDKPAVGNLEVEQRPAAVTLEGRLWWMMMNS